MEKTKLTVRVPKDLLEAAKRYATQHNTTLTRLVSAYLRHLTTEGDLVAKARTERFLSDFQDGDEYLQDHRAILEERYGDLQT